MSRSTFSRLLRPKLLLLGAIFVALCVLLSWQTSQWVRHWALNEIADRAKNTLSLISANLKGELAKYSSQPLMLANNPNYQKALTGPYDGASLAVINADLERINTVSGASDTYLMDANGHTIAASNWSSEKTFIGRNFSFRPYFKAAMQGRLGRYFALGTTSGERGYYFAYPVRQKNKIIGAIVVKMQVDHLEDAWASKDHEVIVIDENGVVFLSSRPDWLFRTIRPLSQKKREALLKARQFGNKPLNRLAFEELPSENSDHRLIHIGAKSVSQNSGAEDKTAYLMTEQEMRAAGWKIVMLANTQGVRWQVNVATILTLLTVTILTLLATILYQRRRRLDDRIKIQDAANLTLENRVTERTKELRQTNDRLLDEIQERRRTEDELLRTQASLVQATKLAALGQMSAGLSHEINQPLAAIGTYAQNAQAFIERGDSDTALKNLTNISSLIKRMARIINNLRTYARDEPIALSPVPLGPAIEGALDLLQQRIESQAVIVEYEKLTEDTAVLGGEVRLQQVLVNLISNALDAMRETERRHLSIKVSEPEEIDAKSNNARIQIHVRDTGAGIDENKIADIFDPFYSTKETGEGMGLGLSITYGIVKQFGGEIKARNISSGGAEFVVTLASATCQNLGAA